MASLLAIMHVFIGQPPSHPALHITVWKSKPCNYLNSKKLRYLVEKCVPEPWVRKEFWEQNNLYYFADRGRQPTRTGWVVFKQSINCVGNPKNLIKFFSKTFKTTNIRLFLYNMLEHPYRYLVPCFRKYEITNIFLRSVFGKLWSLIGRKRKCLGLK